MSPTSIINLATVHDNLHLANQISGVPKPSASAIASTVLLLSELQHFSDEPEAASHCSFIPERLLILPPSQTDLPGDQAQSFLSDLARAAQAGADALACSSVLAGQGSESDDTGDASIWLGKGDFGQGHEANVLAALGLTGWAQRGKLGRVELSATHGLPLTMAINSGPEIDKLVELLRDLGDKYCFRVSAPLTGGVVVFILLGRVEEQGWGGLIGVGTWSDD